MYSATYWVVFQKVLADPDDVSWRPVWATGRNHVAAEFAADLAEAEGRPTSISQAQSQGRPEYFYHNPKGMI